jgi:hypothetical protein
MTRDDDTAPPFLFARNPEYPGGWGATLLTRFPAGRSLTSEQIAAMGERARQYINIVWDMDSEHRSRLMFAALGPEGEPRPEGSDELMVLAQRRFLGGAYWMALIESTAPARPSGDCEVAVEIFRAGARKIH